MKTLLKIAKILLLTLGSLSLVVLVCALTPAPFYMHYALGDDPVETPFEPDRIVMFGGAGMPSESNLIRLYYAAECAQRYEIPVILVHPEDSLCQAAMKRELVRDGVSDDHIFFMTRGTNTRSQVLELKKAYPETVDANLLIITSPEHVRRTVKCLRKAGFTHVKGLAAREATVDFDLSLKAQDLKGNEAIPSVESTNIRYTFWNYLQLEILCFREYAALAYYRIKGWI